MFALLTQTVTAKAVNEQLSECQASACVKNDGCLKAAELDGHSNLDPIEVIEVANRH